MTSSSLVQSTISICNYGKPGLCHWLTVSIWAKYFLNLGTVPHLQTKMWLWILQLHCGQDNAGMVRLHAFQKWGMIPRISVSLPKLYSAFSAQLCQHTYNSHSAGQHPVKIDGVVKDCQTQLEAWYLWTHQRSISSRNFGLADERIYSGAHLFNTNSYWSASSKTLLLCGTPPHQLL